MDGIWRYFLEEKLLSNMGYWHGDSHRSCKKCTFSKDFYGRTFCMLNPAIKLRVQPDNYACKFFNYDELRWENDRNI